MSDFDFVDESAAPRKYSKSEINPLVIAGGFVVLAAIVVGAVLWIRGTPVKLSLAEIETQTVNELETLTFPLKVTAEGLSAGEWVFRIVSGPPGAAVDLKSGVFTWQPDENQGPGEYPVTVAVLARGGKQGQGKQSFTIVVREVNQAPDVAPIPAQTVAGGDDLRVSVKATDADRPAQKLSYRLKQGPPGAQVDARTGVFTWTAPETSAEQNYSVEIIVTDAPTGGAESLVTFQVRVPPPASASLRLVAALKEAGLAPEKSDGEAQLGFHGRRSCFKLENATLTLLDYDSDELADDDAMQITDGGKTLFGEPATWLTRTRIFKKGALIVLFSGDSQRTLKALADELGEPYIVADASRMKAPVAQVAEPTVLEALVDSLAKLHEKKDLLGKKDYPGVRKLFAELFEKQNEFTLNKLAAADGANFKKWLDDHVDFKEEFFIAVSPEDDFAAAWKILQTLHEKFPRVFDEYGQLAIATALTWDNEHNVYHYDGHQRRTHSKMPGGLLGAMESFRYFVEMADAMQGRTQFLPWEFQVHMVNSKTPRAEREWATANYVSRRTMYGKCYSDVPYDTQMLKTESRVCKLEGLDYTLPNLLQVGGVCAMQADFAARVGQSIGVPAAYVSGDTSSGDRHAWVMWVEVKQVSSTSILFTLESHGRYFGDKFYVGVLHDPQSGREITDRELELRLQAVGLNPVAFHHAKLVMQAYPQLRDKLKWKPAQEIVFLNSVIDLCPGNEDAWRQVALLARGGKIGTDSYKLMNAMFDKMFRTFANFPDFTWKVFDDLVQYQKNAKQRYQFYERLIQMYEAAERPDLACEARLKLSEYWLAEGRSKEVIEGLAYAIKKFPDDGRYVPRLLDKLEEVCDKVKGADELLLHFYLEFIPLIPQMRGAEPSPYCMRMLARAATKFKAAGQAEQAAVFAAQLAKLKASRGE